MQAVRTQKFWSVLVAIALVAQMFTGGGWLTSTAWADEGVINIGDSTTSTVTVTVTTDEEGKVPLGDTAVDADATLYGHLEIDFSAADKPEAAHGYTVVYQLPTSIAIAKDENGILRDPAGNKAGTWSVDKATNIITLLYDASWADDPTHAAEVIANVDFDFKLAGTGLDEENPASISFPGTGTTTTVNISEKDVNGQKSAASLDAENQSINWTVVLWPQSNTSNLVVTDTIGENLTFNNDFMVNGQPVTATVDGKTATIDLGDITYTQNASYTLTYSTKVSDDAWNAALTGDGTIANADNKASWTSGKDQSHKSDVKTADAPKVTTTLISKSNGSGTNDDITWTVTVNGGSILADVSGYTVTDTLDSNQEFTGSYTVVNNTTNQQVATGTLDSSSNTFNYTLPADAGKSKFTITYHSKVKDGVAKNTTVSNTAKIIDGDDEKDSSTGTFGVKDNTDYIVKSLVTDGSDTEKGVAKWSSTIAFSEMDESTTSATYTDTFSKENTNIFKVDFSDISLAATNGVTLEQGTDYTVTINTNTWDYNSFKIEFTAAGMAKLAGKADVTVSYTTTSTVTSNGTYINTGNIVAGNVNDTDSASYKVNVESTPNVLKKATNEEATWNADYAWGDGTKGAWIVDWTIQVNRESWDSTTSTSNLRGKDVVVTDDLAGMTYVANSATYTVHGFGSYNSYGTGVAVEPVLSDSGATFTMRTDEMYYSQWYHPSIVDDKGDWYGYVELKYQTAVKATDLKVGSGNVFKNAATATSGDLSWDEGNGIIDINNKVINKASEYNKTDAVVRYTVQINPAALDLVEGSDELTLVDTLGSTGQLLTDSFTLKDASGATLSADQYSVAVEDVIADGVPKTKMTLKVKDATSYTLSYEVKPLGTLGDTVDVSNEAEFEAVTNSKTQNSIKALVANASGGTQATSYGITVNKYDGVTLQKLSGAEFTLYKVNLDSGEKNVERTGTSNASGVVQFGSSVGDRLDTDTLYAVAETKAPTGYKTSSIIKYVVLRGVNDDALYSEIQTKAAALGINYIYTGSSISFSNEQNDGVTGSATITATKTLTGATLAAEQFSFKLQEVDENGDAVENGVTETVKNDADGKVAFSELTNLAVGTHYYTVSEVVPEDADKAAGITYDSTVYNVTVTVAEDGGTTVAYTKDGAEAEGAAFSNAYAPESGSCSIEITKTVNGKNPQAGETFTFELLDEQGNRVEGTQEVTTNADGKATITGLTFTEAGEYTYKVHETSQDGNGWTNADDFTVTVSVVDNDGTLVATPNYGQGNNSALMDNTYTPKAATATIKISKSVIGDNADANEQFKFELFDESKNSKGEVTCKGGETKSFETVSFNKTGVYNYTIKETSDLGDGWKNETGDVTAKITVSQNETTRDLEATVEYTSHLDNDATVALIKNSYTKPEEKTTAATINISKSVQGDNASADEQFTFDLYDGENKLGTVTTKAGNVASFDAISFKESDLDGAESKDFTYTIKEQAKTGDAWFDVTGSITAKVTLSKDADGNLQANVDYSTNGNEQQNAYLYTNKYSTATATIGVSKTINGANPTPDEQFTFELYKGNDKIDSVSVKGGESATYTNLNFDTEGEYTYTIKETAKLGWTNETGDVTATVKVTRDTESNELKATVTYTSATEDKSSALFTNKYSVGDATATIKISKNVIGDNANENEQFKFELFDSEDKSLGEVTCKGGETKSFADLTFSKTGTYTYKIKETSDLGYGWSNETGDVTATVTVSQNQQTGNLEASVKYTSHLDNDATTALITNKYDQPKSAEPTISVNKKIAGDNPQAEETFTFELQDENGKKVEGVETITLKADETKSFEGLKLDKEGTFTYTIHETSDNGAGWTNAQDVTATVKVSYDKESNSYKVDSVEYSTANDEKNAAFFENVFKAGEATISVSKKVAGDNAQPDEKFTFELQDENGKKVEGVDAIELKADETKSFTGLKFTKEGVYKYIIHETSENGEGWTNAQDVTATVTVTKGENNELVAKVEYSTTEDGGNSAFFLNKYEKPETPGDTTDEGGKKTTETVNPKTGDDSPAGLFAGLAALSALVAGASAYGMRRTRKSN